MSFRCTLRTGVQRGPIVTPGPPQPRGPGSPRCAVPGLSLAPSPAFAICGGVANRGAAVVTADVNTHGERPGDGPFAVPGHETNPPALLQLTAATAAWVIWPWRAATLVTSFGLIVPVTEQPAGAGTGSRSPRRTGTRRDG